MSKGKKIKQIIKKACSRKKHYLVRKTRLFEIYLSLDYLNAYILYFIINAIIPLS